MVNRWRPWDQGGWLRGFFVASEEPCRGSVAHVRPGPGAPPDELPAPTPSATRIDVGTSALSPPFETSRPAAEAFRAS